MTGSQWWKKDRSGLNGAHREVFFGGWSPLSLIFYGVERFGKILFIVERYESWKYFQCLLKTVLTSGGEEQYFKLSGHWQRFCLLCKLKVGKSINLGAPNAGRNSVIFNFHYFV
ncbi:hypothetical protein QL285_012446 [Trifolium repens]|nr:hypothetical protein QL285_012446 [Trifolium repens]